MRIAHCVKVASSDGVVVPATVCVDDATVAVIAVAEMNADAVLLKLTPDLYLRAISPLPSWPLLTNYLCFFFPLPFFS